MTPTELAQAAYGAYGAVTDHKNYAGLPMPEWDDLGDTIRNAWIAAAGAVRTEVLSIREAGFAEALDVLRQGGRVWREGWNGKGMWLALQHGYPDGVPINANTAKATGLPEGTIRVFGPYIVMCTVDGSFVPWVASQTDLLAFDWVGTGNLGDPV
jgi:Protein of unknown function (DUF2829)